MSIFIFLMHGVSHFLSHCPPFSDAAVYLDTNIMVTQPVPTTSAAISLCLPPAPLRSICVCTALCFFCYVLVPFWMYFNLKSCTLLHTLTFWSMLIVACLQCVKNSSVVWPVSCVFDYACSYFSFCLVWMCVSTVCLYSIYIICIFYGSVSPVHLCIFSAG